MTFFTEILSTELQRIELDVKPGPRVVYQHQRMMMMMMMANFITKSNLSLLMIFTTHLTDFSLIPLENQMVVSLQKQTVGKQW